MANVAKEKAAEYSSKASEGLSRVSSAAGPAIAKYGTAAVGALGRVGGRTGRFVDFVQSKVPQTVYYSKVGAELGKIIFHGRKMSPPSMATFQSYFQPLINAARNPTTLYHQTAATAGRLSPQTVLARIRNVSREELTTAGIVGAEVIGFFTVGEMIGRMKVVGYRTSGAHAHH